MTNDHLDFKRTTTSIAEWFTRMPLVWEVESSFPKGQPNLTQRYKQFATASTSTQVAVMPWSYDAEMGTANSLYASAYYGEYNKRFVFFGLKIM